MKIIYEYIYKYIYFKYIVPVVKFLFSGKLLVYLSLVTV